MFELIFDEFCIFLPQELCESPKLVEDGVSCDDLVEGELGNTWFVSACASLARDMRLWKRVSQHIGIKRKHFPGYLAFVKSDSEFWCFLVWRHNKRLKKNNRDAGDLKRHRAHYDIIAMISGAAILDSLARSHVSATHLKIRHLLTPYVDIALAQHWLS